MTKFRVLSLDKTYLKLQHFIEKKLRIWRTLSEKEKIHKVLMYERIKLMRQIYLYTNRYIRKNNNIIGNSNKDFHHLGKHCLINQYRLHLKYPTFFWRCKATTILPTEIAHGSKWRLKIFVILNTFTTNEKHLLQLLLWLDYHPPICVERLQTIFIKLLNIKYNYYFCLYT